MPPQRSRSAIPDLFRQANRVGDAWITAASGKVIEVGDPATGEVIGTVPSLSREEARRAIDAANTAWPAWRKKTSKERAAILRKWHDLMLENADDLALIMTAEQGKPLTEAKGEIVYAASFIEWFAEEGKRVEGDTLQSPWADRRLVVTKEPIGVCAAITPWNFPAAMITRKVGPALAAGCPMVVKPAELTPFSALALAVLAERAGVPKGVFSVITGPSGEQGEGLCTNPDVRKLSFTGSTEVGRKLQQYGAAAASFSCISPSGSRSISVADESSPPSGSSSETSTGGAWPWKNPRRSARLRPARTMRAVSRMYFRMKARIHQPAYDASRTPRSGS